MDFYCFHFRGGYVGRLDDSGTYYDKSGRKRARVVDNERVYDLAGRYLGRIDAQGSFFEADGSCSCYFRSWTDRPPLPPPHLPALAARHPVERHTST